MSDDLAAHLRLGCVLHPRRWSGDTHADLGGSIDEQATDALMGLAADEIERLRAVLDHPIIAACIGMNALQFPELAPPAPAPKDQP